MLCWLAAVAMSPAVVASAAARDNALHVSFASDASVRLQGQRFVARTRSDAAAVNDAVAREGAVRIQRLVEESPASLDAVRGSLLARGKRGVPDLNRHYRIVTSSRVARDRLLADLRALAVVETAILEPEPAPPPATRDFTSQQRYGFAAPGGIGVAAITGLGGGLGQNVKIVDVEYSWNRSHEDLAKAAPAATVIANGIVADPFNDNNHGTAVLGELVATANKFGVTGLAQGSALGVVNAYSSDVGYTPANAVNLARQNLSAGDVILLEQQWQGIPGTGSEAVAYVPSEYLDSVYDAVKLATQSGIIVVEAAGNGGVNLDNAAYTAPFPGGKSDSGAIIVGAGSGDCSAPANSRLSFSTYGARVNLQGWGQCVTTTGYGGLFNGGTNARYTKTFNGTSSAAPIVASAAALFSSVFQARAPGGRAPTPQAVRKRLVDTGTAQGAGGHIGPLPNVAVATTNFDFTPPTVTFSSGPTGTTTDATPTFAFAASEGSSTLECRVDADEFAACVSPLTTDQLGDGQHTLEVKATDAALNPGSPASRVFTVDTTAPPV